MAPAESGESNQRRKLMRTSGPSIWLALCVLHACALKPLWAKSPAEAFRFEISFSRDVGTQPLDGRVYLLVSKDGKQEPRFQISRYGGIATQQIFGVDVDGLRPGSPAVIDAGTTGYPVKSVQQIPAGDYYVQGFLNVYETFHLASGHTIKLPPEKGEGQKWYLKPGNLYSVATRMHLDPAVGTTIRITLTQKIPPIPPAPDTKFIKYVRVESKLLSRFWGGLPKSQASFCFWRATTNIPTHTIR